MVAATSGPPAPAVNRPASKRARSKSTVRCAANSPQRRSRGGTPECARPACQRRLPGAAPACSRKPCPGRGPAATGERRDRGSRPDGQSFRRIGRPPSRGRPPRRNHVRRARHTEPPSAAGVSATAERAFLLTGQNQRVRKRHVEPRAAVVDACGRAHRRERHGRGLSREARLPCGRQSGSLA